MKGLSIFLFIAFCSCQSKNIEIANLVVSAQDHIFRTSLEHKLTPSDIDRLNRHYPKTLERLENVKPLIAEDIINMTKAGVADDVIIYEIKITKSVFFLTSEDEKSLQEAGVSKKVIQVMKETIDDRY